MFESKERLAEEIRDLLEAIREISAARYACLLDPKGILFQTPEPEGSEARALRRFLEERRAHLFSIPQALASGEAMDDVFEGWERDEFFLAILNGRVALAVACSEAEPLKERLSKPLRALADRLLRFNELYRLDAQGRGLFLGRPRLDMVVVGRASASEG